MAALARQATLVMAQAALPCVLLGASTETALRRQHACVKLFQAVSMFLYGVAPIVQFVFQRLWAATRMPLAVSTTASRPAHACLDILATVILVRPSAPLAACMASVLHPDNAFAIRR